MFRIQSGVNPRIPLIWVPQMKAVNKNVVGREVARLRTERGLSQADFAAHAQRTGWDISRETLAKIESGIRCVTDLEVICLAKVLKTPVKNLFPLSLRK